MFSAQRSLRHVVLICGHFKPFQKAAQHSFTGMYSTFRTLDTAKIRFEDVVDLSRAVEPHVCGKLKDGRKIKGRIAYHFSGHAQAGGRAEPFPDEARGFFYCHRDQRIPSTTAEIRFRVVPDDATTLSSESGTDLMMPDSVIPWSIPIVMLAVKRFRPFQELAVEEGFIQPNCWIAGAPRKRKVLLTFLEQPFVIDLQTVWISVNILTPNIDVHRLVIHRLLCISQRPEFSGKLLVHFERATHTTSFFMRILQVLEPIERLGRAFHPFPTAGTFLRGRYGVKEFDCEFLKHLPSISDPKIAEN